MKAAVVGSGPNGLTAALVLANYGLDVAIFEANSTPGGGLRSHEHLRSGVIHDMCSAIHPLAIASPFFQEFNLERHGLEFAFPKTDLAHPLDDGQIGLLYHDITRTACEMGDDGIRWSKTFGPISQSFEKISDDILRPLLHLPRSPFQTGFFGLNAALPANLFALRWRDESTRALFGGVAAHAFSRLDTPLSSAVGTMLIAAAHHSGWPVAVGGSQSIANALIAELGRLKVRVECNARIERLQQICDFDIVMLDTTPLEAVKILDTRLPSRIKKSYSKFQHGPAAFKVDFLIKGNIPWKNPLAIEAGTVHLGGTLAEISHSEKLIVRGEMPSNPFVLVGQQYRVDPLRSDGDYNPVWAYAHVPNGYNQDATEVVVRQIERFAPGFRDVIVDSLSFDAHAMQSYNSSYIGGDILGGRTSVKQLIARPRLSIDPYYTGIPGVYICSSSTPPGAGVHGMCGRNAAESALKHLSLLET